MGLAVITHTSITDLENMPLSKLFAYNAELEAVLREVNKTKPGKQ
jgi:hypothetical protein